MKFEDINLELLKNKNILLDIDGTLACDKGTDLSLFVKNKIDEIKAHSDIYLCSNGKKDRNRQMANTLGVSLVESNYRKPDSKYIKYIKFNHQNTIVVGDKYIIDGFFAVNIGAEYLNVEKKKKSKNDSISIKVTYLLDDIFGKLLFKSYPYVKLLRPYHWIKNILILSPLFFASSILSFVILPKLLITLLAFSLASSFVYILNDISDCQNDKNHHIKKFRPLSSGLIGFESAIYLALLVLVVLSVLIYFVPKLLLVISLYVVLNILYSLIFKKVAVLDIMMVSLFYILRVLVGGIVFDIYISPWIILCVFFGSLFLTSGKRYGEYHLENRRKVLDDYSKEAVNAILLISSSLSVITYGIYSIIGHHSYYLVYSSIFVTFSIFRVLNDIYKNPEQAEFPELLVFKDKWVFGSFVLWLIYVFFVFYF